MANTVRCKACGYVTEQSKVRDVCPACGLPKTVFEEFDDKISDKRKFILELHLHPIAVHFPQALATLVPLFIVAGLVLESPLGLQLMISAGILSVLLPLSVLGAILAGVIDGKARLKKLSTPLLKKKMILGFLLLAFSVPMALIVLFCECPHSPYYLMGLSLGCIGCEVFLGRIGSKLMYAQLRG